MLKRLKTQALKDNSQLPTKTKLILKKLTKKKNHCQGTSYYCIALKYRISNIILFR